MFLGNGDKIAIIGSAPSSIRKAPWSDESWNVWGCSPGAFGVCPRSDVWFELHRWEPPIPGYPNEHSVPWFSPEYVQFLKEHQGTVFTTVPIPEMANSVVFPYEEMLDKYGPYHFTSSVAWMLAWAIEQKPKAIGLWGVDMAATQEYAHQRPGCQHFIGVAQSLGIDVVLPPESDLMRPTTLYGISEYNPRQIKMLARKAELDIRLANAQSMAAQSQQEIQFLTGALDNINYMQMTWIDDIPSDLRFAISSAKEANPNLAVHVNGIKVADSAATAVDDAKSNPIIVRCPTCDAERTIYTEDDGSIVVSSCFICDPPLQDSKLDADTKELIARSEALSAKTDAVVHGFDVKESPDMKPGEVKWVDEDPEPRTIAVSTGSVEDRSKVMPAGPAKLIDEDK